MTEPRENTSETTRENTFPVPDGAIWVHGFQMAQEILDAVNAKLQNCPKCQERFFPNYTQTDITVNKKHTLSVKINKYKEKFIAIGNTKKVRATQPDYFVHVQYSHTGSAPVYSFRDSRSQVKSEESTLLPDRKTEDVRTDSVSNVPPPRMQAGSEDVQTDGEHSSDITTKPV